MKELKFMEFLEFQFIVKKIKQLIIGKKNLSKLQNA